MIDKLYIHRYIIFPDSGVLEIFPSNFSFKTNLTLKFIPFTFNSPDLDQIIGTEVILQVKLDRQAYNYHSAVQFTIDGSSDFNSPQDLQRLAEICLIGYHHVGQMFTSAKPMQAWKQDKLEQLSLSPILSDLQTGNIPLPVTRDPF